MKYDDKTNDMSNCANSVEMRNEIQFTKTYLREECAKFVTWREMYQCPNHTAEKSSCQQEKCGCCGSYFRWLEVVGTLCTVAM